MVITDYIVFNYCFCFQVEIDAIVRPKLEDIAAYQSTAMGKVNSIVISDEMVVKNIYFGKRPNSIQPVKNRQSLNCCFWAWCAIYLNNRAK